MLLHLRLAALVAVSALLAPSAGAVPFFSIDAGSPSVPGVSNNDVLAPGPIGGPPGVAVPAGALGLPPGPPDELDAMTTGASAAAGPLVFSVDPGAVGVPGAPPDVASEAGAGQAAGDVFVDLGPGNALLLNQAILGLIPATPPGTATAPPIDNLDALDFFGAFPILFSVGAGNTLGVSGADLLTPGGGIAVGFAALGLLAGDDIDALQLETMSGDCLFSLAPGSPSLPGLGAGPGDILVSPGCGAGPAPLVLITAGALGLAPGDNLNALAIVPEPGSAALAGLGLLSLGALRRRARRAAIS